MPPGQNLYKNLLKLWGKLSCSQTFFSLPPRTTLLIVLSSLNCKQDVLWNWCKEGLEVHASSQWGVGYTGYFLQPPEFSQNTRRCKSSLSDITGIGRLQWAMSISLAEAVNWVFINSYGLPNLMLAFRCESMTSASRQHHPLPNTYIARTTKNIFSSTDSDTPFFSNALLYLPATPGHFWEQQFCRRLINQ